MSVTKSVVWTAVSHARKGVIQSMQVVHRAQGRKASFVVTKADETIVTATDRTSAAAAAERLKSTGIPLMAEDGEQNSRVANLRQFFDPLDGTSAFAGGLMTSTVIWSLYDVAERQIVATIVGEPVSGRVWTAYGEGPTQLEWFTDGCLKETSQAVSVEKGSLSRKTTVSIDVSHGFTRSSRQILTDAQMGKLFSALNTKTKILMPGSNGLMHAIVANGGIGSVGSITTALGGPWDACGVLLVLQAGGSAKAFHFEGGRLQEESPLAVEDYDILITGNSEETVGALVLCLKQAVQ